MLPYLFPIVFALVFSFRFFLSLEGILLFLAFHDTDQGNVICLFVHFSVTLWTDLSISLNGHTNSWIIVGPSL